MRQQAIPGSLSLDFSAPHQDGETSRAAAKAIEPDAASLRGRVLECLRKHSRSYGLTDEEIQSELAMNPSTERPRRIELVRLGLVEDSRVQGVTVSGRKAIVWRATK